MDSEILNQILQKLDHMDQKITGLEQRFDVLEQRFDVLEQRFGKMEKEMAEIKAINLRMEANHGDKIQAIIEGYSVNNEKIIGFEPRLVKIENILDKHEILIKILQADARV